MVRKRTAASPAEQVANGGVKDKSLLSKKNLLSYMVDETYEDGSRRLRSKVAIFVQDGMLKGAIQDANEKCSLYVASDTLEGVLRALEDALTLPSPDWRDWPKDSKGKGR